MPLLPAVQSSRGVAGLLSALQVDAITALLVRHMVSAVASAFAVIISPLTRLMLLSVQVLPELTFTTVPIADPFLYTVMVAEPAAPGSADFVQLPLIFTVPVPSGASTEGAAVHIAVAQTVAVLKIAQGG